LSLGNVKCQDINDFTIFADLSFGENRASVVFLDYDGADDQYDGKQSKQVNA
jgi:hypothetical protein